MKKGITLVSLVITIIVLLILATVAISMAVSSDGLFTKAGQVGNTWNTAVAREQDHLYNLLDKLGVENPVEPDGDNPSKPVTISMTNGLVVATGATDETSGMDYIAI